MNVRSLFYRRMFYRTLSRGDIEKLMIFAQMVHRAFLANILTLRESAGIVTRRFSELYRAGYFNLYQDIVLNRGQRILLGACVISFAQDAISEDEMIATAEAFDVNKYNEVLNSTPEIDKFCDKLPRASDMNIEEVIVRRDLRSYLRDIHLSFREMIHDFLKNSRFRVHNEEFIDPTNAEKSIGPETPPSEKLLMQLSNRLTTDGTGFVDSDWELMLDKRNLRMWRRPVSKCGLSNGCEKTAVGFYEYRVCGSFDDISALCFLEVQLNLAYRRQWDSSVALLESTPTSAVNNGGEIVRWISKFPFPMAKREYIYARRWWFTEAAQQVFALIISRAVTKTPVESLYDNQPGIVSVKAYESNMLIRSHESIDKLGLDFFLVYSDDPQLTLSAEATSKISSTVIPRLLEKFHVAARTIAAQGLPEGVPPVILTTPALATTQPTSDNAPLTKAPPFPTRACRLLFN